MTELPAPRRSAPWLFPALALLPVLAAALLAGTLDSIPAVLIILPGWWLALPLLSLAAVRSLPAADRHVGADTASLFAQALAIWAHGALLLLVLAAPALAWQQSPTLATTLAVAACLVLAMLVLWRHWPALLLPLHDPGGALAGALAPGARLARAWRAGRALTASRDVFLSHGLPVLLAHGLLLLAPLALVALPDRRMPVLLGLAVLAVPLAWLAYWLMHRHLHRLLLPAAATAATDAPALPEAPAIPTHSLLRASALRTALREGDIDHALAIIEAGVDPSAPAMPDEADQRGALFIAATLNDSRPLRALIAAGADVNHRQQHQTPLLAAVRDSYYGRPEIVLALLANGARLDDRDESGRGPLHHAALSVEPAVAAMLLDAGADIDALDTEGWTPLALACAAGNRPVAGLLLGQRANPAPAGGRSALCAAASATEPDVGMVEQLLRARVAVDVRDRDGSTPLHQAVLAGHTELVRALLAAGARVDEADAQGRTALLLACQADPGSERVAMLIAAGADADRADLAGETARMLQGRHNGSDGDPSASGDATPETLLGAGRYDALQEWLADAAPAQRADLALAAALHGAPRALADALARPLPADVAGADEQPLLDAALAQWPGSAPLLLAAPAAGVSVAGGGRLARLLAQDGGDSELQARIALNWLDHGADPFCDPHGASPLHHAVARGLDDVVLRLLERGAWAGLGDRAGLTALHLALGHEDERALRLSLLLLRHGADPEAAAGSGETPLGLALDGDRGALVEWLRWRWWRLPGRRLGGHDLAAAARAGDLSSVRRLLRLGLSVDGRDAQGSTALIRAAGGGHRELLDELLDHGADTAARADGGMTALAAAAVAGHPELVKRLLDRGATVDQACGNGATALIIAAACGASASIHHLLAAGARRDASDQAGNNALHAAAGFAFASASSTVARTLLLDLLVAGLAADAVNDAGLTPLHVACGAAAVARPASAGINAALDVLLSRSQALRLVDRHGCTPLHYAAAHGQMEAVRRLLGRGADPALRDHGGWRAADYASRYGFTDVAQELRPAAASPAVTLRPG